MCTGWVIFARAALVSAASPVAPAEAPVPVGGSGFEVELGPYSLTVLRVPAAPATAAAAEPPARGAIRPIDPPEGGFYSKRLDYCGIAIKAPREVADEALFAAWDKLQMMMEKLPAARANLSAVRAELHIIGKDQVTSDLPEHRHLKGKPFDGKLTVDQRTRGLGGLLTSCGEENLLRLEKDRYRGRDICVHEFAHNIFQNAIPRSIREKFQERRRRSLEKGLWVDSYAGSNVDEFFAELSMWYFGTRGDLHMKGAKPADGREGLKAYDPEALALMDDFYAGRFEGISGTDPQLPFRQRISGSVPEIRPGHFQ